MQDKYICSKLVSQQRYFVLIETKPQIILLNQRIMVNMRKY